MGNCTFCGQKAGFLRKKHKECEMNYILGKQTIVESIWKTITNNANFENLDNDIRSIAEKNFIKSDEIKGLFTVGFDKAVDCFLEDGVLSNEEEEKLEKFKTHYNFEQSVIDKNGSLQKLIKASILREVLEGKIPESRMRIEGNLPFMLQKSENIIWVFQNVAYYEQRTKTIYRGRSQGVSIKIAKGLYYRAGSFKGQPVKIEEMKYLSSGLVALTNKHIYFASSMKNFKVPYNKIVTIDPYEDGLGIQRDGTNTKPQILKGLDGWFAYNLITNLNQI